MPDPVATAWVEVRPDLRRFEAEIRAAVANATRSPFRLGPGFASASTAQVALGNSTKQATRALSEQAEVMGIAQTNLNRFSRGIAATGLAMFGLRGATLAATSAFLAGAASITAIGKGVGLASRFAQQLSVLQAVSGATAEEMQAVGEEARALGADFRLPGVTAIDAAEAMTELVKAGLSVGQAIRGARGVLQLAGAANINFAEATELVASALNAFGLSGARATEVADTLANAANLAQGSIVDIGVAFQQAAAIGHQVGLSFQDTTLFITQLAKAGLSGSDAGTSLRTALIRLINPTKQARKFFQEFGLEVRDAQGNLRPEFFVDLGTALEGVSKKQRDLILAQIGGQDAVRALSILTRQNIGQLLAQRDALSKSGTAQTVAQARMTAFAGAGANLANTLESIGLSLGTKVLPSLTRVTDGLRGLVTDISRSQFVTVTLRNTVTGIASGFQTLGGILRGLRPVFAGLFGGVNAVVGALGPQTILATATAFFAVSRAMKSVQTGLKALAAGTAASEVGFLARNFSRAQTTVRSFVPVLQAATLSFGLAGGGIGGVAKATRAAAVGIGTNLKTAVAGAARSFNVWAIGIAAVAGGLAFILTRESATERATRHLTEATNELVSALEGQQNAQRALISQQGLIASDRQAVADAKAADNAAQRAVANLKVTATQQERTNAENRAKVTAQNLALAQERLRIDLQDLSDTQRVARNETEKRNEAFDNEGQKIEDVIGSYEELRRSLQGYLDTLITIRAGEPEIFAARQGLLEQERREREGVVKATQKQIDALRHEGATANELRLSDRLEVLRKIELQIDNISRIPTIFNLVVRTDDLEKGLTQARDKLAREGDEGGAAYINHLIDTMFNKRALVKQALGVLFEPLIGLAGQKGDETGQAYGAGLLSAIQRIIAQVNSLILAGLGGVTTRAVNQANTLLTNIQRAQIGGASLATQKRLADEARARADAAVRAADERVRRAERGGGLHPHLELERARRQRESALQVQAQAAAEQARITGEMQAQRDKAIQDAQEKQQKADQHEQDMLAAGQARFDIRRAQVEATKSLVDDIKFFRDFRAFLLREIAHIAATVKDSRLRTSILQALNQALVQNGIEFRKTLAQQKQNAADRKKQAFEDRQESLDLDIRIAQDREDTKKEIAALLAKNRNIRRRIAETHATGLALKRWLAEIEDNNARIRELRKEQNKNANEGKQLAFEFLQAEQGFASTILSNLLPRGATAGAVSGTGGVPSVFVPTGGFATAVHRHPPPATPPVPGPAGFASAVHARGATAGQSNTQIHVLQQILTVLRKIAGETTHPESRNHRVIAKNNLDTAYGV